MTTDDTQDGFTAEERAAMKQRAAELKASARRGTGATKAEADARDCVEAIASMPDSDRVIAEALHAIVADTAPDLAPRTWYGMPAYARAGKVIVFFKPAAKFKVRYAEVGFNEWANLDDGDIWPTAFAVTAMTGPIREQLTALVRRAVR
jgi:uncharacterized protein YdhG (YjbR/CyaY superfamily)